ncbi:MAG: cellulase family glycosylhydrolase [Bacilli bacterium]|jgi:aryl-phospho-beta-D-glucosidase BglC (GH1 family)|nr:cellulase family glycosylhydrolase [Bacilli bacterium]MBQ4182492.1 cellulase family glycosylhydrolase [Bacilli bacterium]
MKSLSKTLLMTSFLLLSACNFGSKESSSQAIIPSSSKYESARKDYVKADGADLLDSEGNKFLLRGTNLGSYYLHERWMALTDSPDMLYTVNKLTERFDRDAAFELLDIYQTNFWTSEDFDAVQALGLNCLRFPISYMDVFDCDFDLMRSDNPTAEELLNMTLTLRKDHLLKMDKFIVEAEKRGIYIILDLHGAYGSQNGNDHSIDSRQHDWLWRQDDVGSAFRELTLELWTVLAEHYKDYKNIAAYDLLNEPAGDANDQGCLTSTTGKLQWDYFDDLYKAIRVIDPNHTIIMESCWGAEDLPQPTTYGWENVMYEFHHYDSTTDDEGSLRSHQYRVSNIINANFGVPLYMGEFCPHCSYEGWADILNLFNENHIHWTNWNYRVRGYSEWGLYHIRTDNEGDPNIPFSEIPKINSDSFEEIERKWGRDQRKGFLRNDALCEVIENAAKAKINF